MNSISKKALFSMLILATAGVVSAEETVVLDTQSFGTMIPVDAITTAQGMKVWRDIDKTRFELFKDACDNVVTSVRAKAGNAVAAVCATRPVQFMQAKVAQYPKTSKAVAGTIVGTAVAAALYKAATSERGQKVRAQIANSQAYKSAANFVQANKETLAKVAAGTAVVVATVVGGKKYVLPRITQWLVQAAC